MQQLEKIAAVNHALIIRCLRTVIGNFIRIKKAPNEKFKHH